MKAKKLLGLLLAATVLFVAAAPISAQVATIDSIAGVASVSGQVARIQAPASVEQGDLEDNNRAFLFLEKEDVRLGDILRVNVRGTGTFDRSGAISGGSVSSGTRVNSYFIHFDRVGQFATLGGISGSITFNQDILGLVLLTNDLNLTTPTFRAVRTLYGIGHGLEFSSQAQLSQDSVTITSNRRTLRFELENNVQTDQIRVITLRTNATDGGGSNNGGGNSGGTGDCNNPTATNDSVSTNRNSSVTINVLNNDDDANNNTDNCTISIDSNPSNGSVSVNNTNETITYTPDSGFTGTDRFDYEICDSGNDCATARVTVTVTSSSNGGGSGSGSGDDDNGSRVTLRTLLPEADDCSAADEARIDIVPGNRENMIRLDDETGYTPVAILSSEDFPAPNCIDVSTVMFGPDGVADHPALSCGVVNVNFDRWKDIVCDFKTSDLGFSTDDSMGELTADTIDNDNIDETDDVMVIGVRRIKNFLPPRSGSNSNLAVKSMQLGQSLFVMSQGAEIAQTSVQIYNTQGQLLQSANAQGSLLRVNLTTKSGSQLANGVYFYVVTSLDSEGNVIGHILKKIAILR